MSIEEIDTEEIANELQAESKTTEQPLQEQASEQVATEQVQETAQPTQAELNWAEYGLPHFAGRKPDEIAGYVKSMLKRYGDQANELGELRKLKDKYGKVEETVSGKQVDKVVDKLDDYEYKAFADMFVENPIQALDKFIIPKIEERLMGKVFGQLDERIKPQIEGFAQNMNTEQAFRQFTKSNPDYVQHKELMVELMTPENLGENADFEEVYNLSKLYKTDSGLAAETFNLMKRGFEFNQAKRYASGVVSAPVNTKEKIKQEIGSIRSAKPSGVRAATTDKNIQTWDDVLDETLREIGAS